MPIPTSSLRYLVVALSLACASSVHAQTATGGTSTTATAAKATARDADDWQRLYRVSKIMGTDVRNLQGDKVGDIKDVVVNRNGTITYAIVSTGGFLGMGNRLHAVPWEVLQTQPGKKYRVLDIDKDRLKKAPSFDPDNWPNVVDDTWGTENRRFYGASVTNH
ncbi:MAG: PRC-barrel domain-containing protein [Acidobacteriota bacterium]